MLNKEKIADIKAQFAKVIAYSQNVGETPMLDDLFEKWLEGKRDFIEAMNGDVIYEWPDKVAFELGPAEKKLRLNDFINVVENRYENYDLVHFLECNRDGFFSNHVVEEYEYHGTIIPKGMKLLRAFKFFESDTYVLEQLQNAASMIIQEDKIEGTLCLSVHPLDFLSTSENNHNWRSCHALDGEYRAGNLSHMIDHSTIICYIKSSKEEVLPNFPQDVKWNSKKWRVLFYFSDNWDMIFAGRQYPFTTSTGLNFVKDNVFRELHFGEFSSWCDKKIHSFDNQDIYVNFRSPYLPVGKILMPLDELVINEPGSLQFNDVLSSSCYDALYAFRRRSGYFRDYTVNHKTTRFHIGGQCKCLRCGSAPINISSSVMCNDCELEYGDSEDDMFAYCSCCGRRYFYDDGVYITSTEECICPTCAEREATTCQACGELHYNNEIVYDRKTEQYVCQYCFEDMREKERESEVW